MHIRAFKSLSFYLSVRLKRQILGWKTASSERLSINWLIFFDWRYWHRHIPSLVPEPKRKPKLKSLYFPSCLSSLSIAVFSLVNSSPLVTTSDSRFNFIVKSQKCQSVVIISHINLKWNFTLIFIILLD